VPHLGWIMQHVKFTSLGRGGHTPAHRCLWLVQEEAGTFDSFLRSGSKEMLRLQVARPGEQNDRGLNNLRPCVHLTGNSVSLSKDANCVASGTSVS